MASLSEQTNQATAQNYNNTNSSILDDLLENSRKLRQDIRLPDLPTIQLGLGEIERRAKTLNATTSQRTTDARAHYLLQAAGVQPDEALRNLESIDMGFDEAPSRATAQAARLDTDIEGYLQSRKEQNIVSAIEDGMRRTTQEFETYVANNVNLDWDAQKKRIYEHFGLTTKPRSATESTATKPAERSMYGQSSFGTTFTGRAATATGGMGSSTFGQSRFIKASLGQLVLGTQPKEGNQTYLFSDTDTSNQGTPMNQMYSRQQNYAVIVKKLNETRLRGGNFPVLQHFAETAKNSQDVVTTSIYEAWKMLGSIVGENPSNNRIGQRYYAKKYLSASYESSEAVQLREHIEKGARTYLEQQFLSTIEDLIARNPQQARVGGVPTAEHKIKAYINIKLLGKDKWKDTTFETVNDYPGWAIVFYLLRAGFPNDAAAYVQNNLDTFSKLERNFIYYITAYINSPERRLPRNLHDRLHAEYNQRLKFLGEGTDPFKQAVYKILGRCELQTRTIPEILTSAEDWMWLQLVLTRESNLGDEPAQEVYTVGDLRKAVLQFGGKHFGLANSNFGLYFQMLLMAGLFENAVQYLYSFLYADAVHFAIALSYYGLLNISDDNGEPQVSLLSYTRAKSRLQGQQATINFARLVGHYTIDFRKTNSEEAVDYIALLYLNADLPAPQGPLQQKLCHEALKELVLETRDFARLVGDAKSDGTRQKGAIEERSGLIGLSSQDEFLHTITSQAAMHADEDDRISDAVLLYHLAEDYDTVIALVNRSLSEYLASAEANDMYAGGNPTVALDAQGRPLNQSISLTSVEDPAELAINMTTIYSKFPSMYAKVSKANWEACGVLIKISEAKKLYKENRYEQCLNTIESINVIPIGPNVDIGAIRRRAQNFGSLHETIARNVPNLLVMSVNCANKMVSSLREGGYVDTTKDWKIKDYSARSRNCILFAGMIQYKMPPDVYNQMAALE